MPFELHIGSLPDMRSASEKIKEFFMGNMKNGNSGLMVPGDSPVFQKAAQKAVKAARQDVPVLLNGESGAGKEIFARFITQESLRRDKPFVCVNCASIPDTLIESELFGHKKGALQERIRMRPERSGRQTEEHFSWMKSERLRLCCSRNCCGSCSRSPAKACVIVSLLQSGKTGVSR